MAEQAEKGAWETPVRDEGAAAGATGEKGQRQDGERAEPRGGDLTKSACIVCSTYRTRLGQSMEITWFYCGWIRITGQVSTPTSMAILTAGGYRTRVRACTSQPSPLE